MTSGSAVAAVVTEATAITPTMIESNFLIIDGLL
jgi:hypothetical protein